ncbi:normal mucosa of esophagus-specific gene 1 protein-like isoform X3 [Centruroides sculpturatus]|uniref:normal mucosa of esophagus-specific gene 1 protein-like isoform X2 n=1 Tax=Centruroides sculpturatus TaxID=218467 RepID=UPI000C6D03B7|nr:normal mucosa of esophagus-specific gene 1 protein-like isoform X2 [Centruroides sculpturatus]XP_023210354.1 normal mucosa of esophagus-specific gene 1 protein-like isoform X3 [Centruroides sculpturatus]
MGFEKFRGTYPGRDPLMDSLRKLFSLRTMRTHPELVPLVFITAAATTGMVSSVLYHLFYNLDARFVKGGYPRWELVDPEKPQKLITIKQKWERNPQLDELHKIIGPYKSK